MNGVCRALSLVAEFAIIYRLYREANTAMIGCLCMKENRYCSTGLESHQDIMVWQESNGS